MAITAKARAQTALRATTSLEPAEALAAVKEAASRVHGSTPEPLTTGLMEVGGQVQVEEEAAGRLGLSITGGKRMFELCTLSAGAGARTAAPSSGRRSRAVQDQPAANPADPVSPKKIIGFGTYKAFLDELAAELRARIRLRRCRSPPRGAPGCR